MTFVLPDMAKSCRDFLRLLSVSLAMMSSIKNKVFDPAKILPSFSIQSYRQLPGSVVIIPGSVQSHLLSVVSQDGANDDNKIEMIKVFSLK